MMPTSRARALLPFAALALTAGRAPDPFAPQAFRQPAERELARCPALAWIDYSALARIAARETGNLAAVPTARHASVRGGIPLPHPDGADVLITTVIGSGEGQSTPTETSSAIWRNRRGRWWFDRVDLGAGDRRTHRAGRLAADQARAVDRAFADPCFALEPDYMPLQVPARPGHAARFGYRFILSVVRIEHAGRVRAMLQGVMTDGYRAVGHAVTYARGDRP